MARMVYRFGAGESDGRGDQAELLGGKGAGLAEMTLLGIPVPPGFTITTDVCNEFYKAGEKLPAKLAGQVEAAVAWVGEKVGARFGGGRSPGSSAAGAAPLLLSVRSGAPVSMPGMLDTILNLGLNDETAKALIAATGNPRFVYDCYRRFVAMYGETVLGVSAESEHDEDPFDEIIARKRAARGVVDDRQLDEIALRELVTEFKIEILRRTHQPFPEDPAQQLWGAIGAVFRSWQNPRAEVYRRMNNIDRDLGTAVTVQAMVFGNLGDTSASGVCFTRNPSSGEPGLYGEYLVNAQGEDVVAGIRTPEPIEKMATDLPAVHRELTDVCQRLERHFTDMQDIEFTVQQAKLWLLQTRRGKRTGKAMVRIAVDLVAGELIDREEAILRVDPEKLSEVMHSTVDPSAKGKAIAKGLPASPGATIGKVVFTAGEAEEWVKRGEAVILVRTDTSPEDIHGMKVAAGILTARGGMTSHAAVVARGIGRCCITAMSALQVNPQKGTATVAGHTIKRGDTVTLDGSTGELYLGPVPLRAGQITGQLETLMEWVDEVRRLRVRANADTPADATTARAFGAEGIGLCRTEHMFFAPERILAVRQMIVAADEAGRRAALAKILPMQRQDFIEIFRAMDGYPVTIRLLDPPLHEFLPHTDEDVDALARELGKKPGDLRAVIAGLHEANPMLGHRGCRLAVSYPEVYETQTRAIVEAAVAAQAQGIDVQPEIMIPFVAVSQELGYLRARVQAVIDEIIAAAAPPAASRAARAATGPMSAVAAAPADLEFLIGTMIELPRACVVADRIAEHADFFSFGTNDLTQTTYGLSRDDAGRFLPDYVERGLMERDPFVSLDRVGVGGLIRLAVDKGRAKRTKLKIGICGEHGGDPSSVEFCHVEGLDYVSCSPFRIPIARVAAARAALAGEARSR